MSQDPETKPPQTSTPARRVTARDVANAAGVSIALVSYAFNRPGRVAPATRERILQTATALGYTGPDPAARALRLGRHGTIAFRGEGTVEDLVGDPAAALVVRGLAKACDRSGRSLVLGGEAAPSAAADGTILWRASAPPDAVGQTVTIDALGPSPRSSGAIDVGADLGGGVASVCRHLREQGHERLAILSWPGAGIRLSAAVQHWAPNPFQVYEMPAADRGHGEVAARTALAEEERPTAVLGLSDELALGALDAARRIELDVPRKLSICGVDDLPAAGAADLTSVFVPYHPMGDLAGAILVDLIAGEKPPAPQLLPTSLTIRATTARAR